jgi:tetratricopeptide (TPR) repeat protein
MSAIKALSCAILVALPPVFPAEAIPQGAPASGIDTAPGCGETNLADLEHLYRTGRYDQVIATCGPENGGPFQLAAEMVLLRSQARGFQGHAALDRALALAREHPDDPAVRSTAASVLLSLGRLAEAEREVEAALTLDPDHAEAWLSRAVLRHLRQDAVGALADLERAVKADPRLRGAFVAYVPALRAARATGDTERIARVLSDRADHLERQGLSGEAERAEAAMLRQPEVGPLFSCVTDDDIVVLPFDACWQGSPYRCVPLRIGSQEYRVLVDTGNRPGWTVHAPELLDELPHLFGGTSTLATGSVDTTMAARKLLTRRVPLGPAFLLDLPGLYSPKPREPYFDANINPFFVQDRVITLDYVTGRLLLRTRDRFERDMAATDPEKVVRIPLYGTDWGFIPLTVNGQHAWGLIETGAEVFQLGSRFAARAGIPLTDARMEFRGREYHYHEGQVDARVGQLPLFSGTTPVWPSRLGDPSFGMFYDAILGPGALEGRFVLSYNPFDGTVVIEPGDG